MLHKKWFFMVGLLLTVLCLNYTPVESAKGGASDIYFSSGVQKYLKGDLDGAVKDLEEAYRFGVKLALKLHRYSLKDSA